VGGDQPDAVAATLPRSVCFQRLNSPECPKAKRVFPPKSDRRDSPEGSSNATTNEETEPVMRLRARADVKTEVTCLMTLTRSMSGSVCEREWEDLGS